MLNSIKSMAQKLTCFLLICWSVQLQAQSVFTELETEAAENWIPLALKSNAVSDLAVGALMAEIHDSTATSVDFYLRALALGEINPEIIHGVSARCGSPELSDACVEYDVLSRFQALAPENAIVHVYSALSRISNGDMDGALEDLSRANVMQLFDDRIIRRTFYVRDKLAEIGYPAERISYISNVYSVDNLNTEFYAVLVNTCNDLGSENLQWNTACKGLGMLMEDYGTTFIALRVGQVLLSNMLGHIEPGSATQRSVDRRRAYTHRWRELASERLAFIRARNDASEEFYQDWLERDEMYAMNQAMGRLDGKRVR